MIVLFLKERKQKTKQNKKKKQAKYYHQNKETRKETRKVKTPVEKMEMNRLSIRATVLLGIFIGPYACPLPPTR
jgi:hypothetical protein